MSKLDQLTKKERRDAESLMRLFYGHQARLTDVVLNDTEYSKGTQERFRKVNSLHDLFDRLGLTDEERKQFWNRVCKDQRDRANEYRKTPVKERKDNKNERNYNGGDGGFSSIRVPRKGHKNAWKKFKKLFPDVGVVAGRRVWE